MNLFIVEELPGFAETIIAHLQQAGVDFTWASAVNGQKTPCHLDAAVDLGLVCSDQSPLDGCRFWLSAQRQSEIQAPFIVVSSQTDLETAVACMKLGASDYILSSRLEQLPQAIEQILEENKAQLHKPDFKAVLSEFHLKEHEKRISNLFNLIPIGLCISDEKGYFVYANEAYHNIYDYPQRELIGKHFSIIVEPDQREAIVQIYQEMINGNMVGRGIQRRMRKDGSPLQIMAANTLLTWDHGSKLLLTSVLDVTNLVQAETALQKSEERFSKIFEMSPVPISITTLAEGRYIDFNDEFVKLIGCSREELVKRTSLDMGVWPDKETRTTWLDTLRKNRKSLNREEKYLTSLGNEVFVITSDEIIDIAGQECILTVYSDITERKISENALRRNEEALKVRANQLTLLNDIGRQISSVLEVDLLLETAASQIHDRFGYHHVAIFTLDEEQGELVMRARLGNLSEQMDKDYRQKVSEGMLGWAARHGERLLSNDISASPYFIHVFPFDSQTNAELCVPIRIGTKVLGVLDVQSPNLNAFDDSDVMVMETLANQLAITLENARLVEEIRLELNERKLAEIEQQQQRDFAMQVMNTMGQGLSVTDENFHLEYVNPAYTRMFGYSEEELIGKETRFLVDPEYKELVEVSHARRFAGENTSYEIRQKRKDGTGIYVLITGAPRWRDGKVVGGITVVTDLTERKLAEEKMNSQVHRLAALRDIDMAITASLDLRITLQIILDKVTNQLDIDAVALFLLNEHTQLLEYAAGRGFRKPLQKQLRLNLGDSLAGRTARERTVLIIPDLSQAPLLLSQNPMMAGEGFVTYYGVPLITKGMVKGILEIYQRSPLPSDPDWLGFLEALATQAAIAIDDARLFEDLQRSNAELILAYDNTLEGWSRALDMRDQETEGHSRRVTDMTMTLAQAMGIYGDELVHVYRGALLHDIGKMGIPDSILLKPGPLTPEEWVIMRQHPENAYKLLSPISHLRRALEIPYGHHEKWDGSGYPRGLKGEEISLSARIFAVVDAWDALNSDRPYRKAWAKKEAFDYIRDQSGKSFDPAVVEKFTQLFPLD